MKIALVLLIAFSQTSAEYEHQENGLETRTKKELWDMAMGFRRQRNQEASKLKRCERDLLVRTSTLSNIIVRPPPKEPGGGKGWIVPSAISLIAGGLLGALIAK